MPDSPRAAMQRFINANAASDTAAMMACLSKSTLADGGFSGPMPADFRFEMGDTTTDGGQVRIPLSVFPPDAPPDSPAMQMSCIMVEEDGEWKFDLAATMRPQMEAMEAAMNEAMGQVGAAMGEALGAVGQALQEGLGTLGATTSAFSDEPLAPSLWEDAPPVGDEDLRPLPAMTPLEIATREVSAAAGRDLPVVADVQSLMDLFGESDPTKLMPWLDGEFCAGLGPAIAASPFHDRLRRVRVEASLEWGQREMVLDGPELVYRVDLRHDDGWYRFQDDLLRVIAPVMAALAVATDDVPEGFTMLPSKDWGVTVTQFRERVAPRAMQRLALLLGAPVALDVDWRYITSEDVDGKRLQVWGLAPALSAVASVCALPEGERPAPGFMHTVRVQDALSDRRASLSEGVLNLEMLLRQGEPGCFRPHELVDVLLGSPIGPPADSGDAMDSAPANEEPAGEPPADENA